MLTIPIRNPELLPVYFSLVRLLIYKHLLILTAKLFFFYSCGAFEKLNNISNIPFLSQNSQINCILTLFFPAGLQGSIKNINLKGFLKNSN